MKYYIFVALTILFGSSLLYSQNEDLQVGGSLNQYRQSQGAYYDYSDPEAINIKVAVWGFVKFPGRYIVPSYSSMSDLLSYAGGPTDDSNLDDLRIFRMKEDSTEELIKFNYNDILWNDELQTIKSPPKLLAGDILVVPGEPRLYFKDYFSISLSVFSALISLAILVINIAK